MKNGKGGMKEGPGQIKGGVIGQRNCSATRGKTVVRGTQALQTPPAKSNGMGGMARGKGGSYAAPSVGAQIPAHLGGHDHTSGRRRGIGY